MLKKDRDFQVSTLNYGNLKAITVLAEASC